MAKESCKIRIRFEPSDVPHTKKAVNYLSLSFALLVLRFFLEKTGLRIWWSCSHSEWDASIWRLLRRSPYPSLHLSQCYWHPRKQLASISHICSHSLMNLGESFLKFFLGQCGKYSGWTEIFISFAMVKDIHQKVPLKHLDSLGRQLIDCWEICCQ